MENRKKTKNKTKLWLVIGEGEGRGLSMWSAPFGPNEGRQRSTSTHRSLSLTPNHNILSVLSLHQSTSTLV